MTNINDEPNSAAANQSNKAAVFFTALALAALMVSAAAGGGAFMIYREFSVPTENAAQSHAHLSGEQSTVAPLPLEAAPSFRRVAAESTDRSDYHFADNTILPPAAARRVIAAWTSNPVLPSMPAPLNPAAAKPIVDKGSAADRPPLTDSGSHYIVDQATGNVVGVDGTAGAAAEARRAPTPVLPAVAVQTPPPEIRVASAVPVRAAIPVTSDEEVASAMDSTDSAPITGTAQYVPVRRAVPVTNARSFDANGYLASQDDLPVARAEAVNPTSRAAGYKHDFRLPEQGSTY